MTNQVFIDGDANEIQLRVQGHSTQSEELQTWEDSGGTELGRITGDGRFQIGDTSLMTTNESLVEAHEESISSSTIQRGINTLGKFTGAISNSISWLMTELQLLGSGTISGLHSALRAKLEHDNDSDSSGADLRASDFEVVNKSGDSSTPVGDLTAVHARVDNQTGAYVSNVRGVASQIVNGSGADIETAAAFEVLPPINPTEMSPGTIDTLIGLEIPDINQGTDNYAIRTGAGKVKLGSVSTGLLKSVNGEVKNIATTTDSDVEMTGATDTTNGATGTVPQPVAGDEGKYLRGDGQWATPSGGSGGANADLIVAYDKKTSGTAGGSSVAGSQTRALNTLHNPNSVSGVSLSSNQIDLPAGSYRVIDISAPAKATDNHQVYVYDVDAAGVLADDNGEDMYGTSEEAGNGDGTMTRSHIMPTVFTLTATTTLEVRHYTEDAVASTGLGNAASNGHETYTIFAVEKL